jgi:hypothetical protein
MRRHPAIGISVCLAAALTLAACTDGGPPRSAGERIVIGDTTIVVAGDPVWGGAVELVEEVSFGVLEGEPEYEFGAFLELAVDAANGVYVFDGQVPALRYYDASGVYVRTLGRGGSGPGEYGDAALGLTVRQSDGRVVLRDARNARLNLYNPDGSHHASWPVVSGLFTARGMSRDTADHLYLKVLTGPIVQGEEWPIGLLHLDTQGQIVDTLRPPILAGNPPPGEGPFDPARIWEFSPLGGFWIGVTDQYVLEHRRPDGTVLRVTRDLEPTPLQPEERSEWIARTEWLARANGQEVPSIPAEKPLFRSMIAGEDGRLWVRLFAEAEKDRDPGGSATREGDGPSPRTWREPIVYDVFEPDGTYLAQLRLPPGASLSVHRGEHVWGVRRDELGTSSVVRFRIVAGG